MYVCLSVSLPLSLSRFSTNMLFLTLPTESDDNHLNQLLGKLDQNTDVDRCIRVARQLLEVLESTDSRAAQASYIYIIYYSCSSYLLREDCTEPSTFIDSTSCYRSWRMQVVIRFDLWVCQSRPPVNALAHFT